MNELLFWLIFIAINSSLYSINFILYYKESSFLPFIKDMSILRELGLTRSLNQDAFRYSAELSILLFCARLSNLSSFAFAFSGFYILILLFNIYQYSLRLIYQAEPNLFNDISLLKNGLVIVWSESKIKVLSLIIILSFFFFLIYSFFSWYLIWATESPIILSSLIVFCIWFSILVLSIYKSRFYTDYPHDLNRRYHWLMVEIYFNLKRSWINFNLSKKKFGKSFSENRKDLKLYLKKNPPNIHIIFLESYGSYYYLEPTIKDQSIKLVNKFQETLSKSNWGIRSNFSRSPTSGGQSWLTYTSMLYGMNIRDNTHYENILHDSDFRQSNGLLKILKESGYTNYNLNPISPINGINVPYKELREFYSIDEWILQETIDFQGNMYGFGPCPPDQYSMNYTMEKIKKEKKQPYTFFYLTKNTHSPFITPPFSDDWKELNNSAKPTHVHMGFMKHPTQEDYTKAMKYQFDNLTDFIKKHEQSNDIFLLMGDHQPPLLANPDTHSLTTPVHIISQNKHFLDSFDNYGFCNNLMEAKRHITHEAMYSIFLKTFAETFATPDSVLPEYEPNGMQL